MGGTAPVPRRVNIKPRDYLHLDAPLSAKVREAYTITPAEVRRHAFFPFLGFEKTERQVDFETENHWKIDRKARPIRYASHSDAAIYSFYADELSCAYEMALRRSELENSVLAYRGGIGSNIQFSLQLFNEVRSRGKCIVACYDISKFFDSIQHGQLEYAVCEVLGVGKLTPDWVKVLNSLTRYAWVEISAVKSAVGRSDLPRRLCSIHQFRTKVRPLIEANRESFGIPQGSPISGLLANVLMLSFDERMSRLVNSHGGSYRRYSDDIAIILPDRAQLHSVEQAINVMLLHKHMRINDKKTCYSAFESRGEGLVSTQDLLQYLGFTFDGRLILVRSSSLKRYYARMKAAIRIAVRAARKAGYPEAEIRRRALVGRFTHWGDARNFVQYAYRASRIMAAPEIKRQLKRHVPIFHDTFQKYRARYYRGVR